MDRLAVLNNILKKWEESDVTFNGGKGSGNFGHSGRPGLRGGSGKGAGSSLATMAAAEKRLSKSIPELGTVQTPKGFRSKVSTGVPGNESYGTGLRKLPRTDNLSSKERVLEEKICEVYENPIKLNEAMDKYDKIARDQVNSGEKDRLTYETDAVKQVLPGWGTTEDILRCKDAMKNNKEGSEKYKRAETELNEIYHNRRALNSIYHQAANAICKAAFERAAAKAPEGASITVTSGGCGAGKGFGQDQLAKGKKETFRGSGSIVESFAKEYGTKKKNSLVWDSAGDQCSSELPWLQAVAKNNKLRMIVLQTNNVDKNMANSLASAQVSRATKPTDGRMVTAKVSADSYVIGNKNITAFYNANKNDSSISFYTVGNPGRGNGFDTKGNVVSNTDGKLPVLSISKGISTVPANASAIETAIKNTVRGMKTTEYDVGEKGIGDILYGTYFGDSHSLKS